MTSDGDEADDVGQRRAAVLRHELLLRLADAGDPGVAEQRVPAGAEEERTTAATKTAT